MFDDLSINDQDWYFGCLFNTVFDDTFEDMFDDSEMIDGKYTKGEEV